MSTAFKKFVIAAAGLGIIASASAPAYAQAAPGNTTPRAQLTPAQAANVQTRRAIDRINGDIVAILNALQWDSSLSGQLAANSAAGEALLRARGAFRSERIVVEKGPAGTARITITLSVGNVRTSLTL